MAVGAWAQPVTVGYLNESDHINDAADVNGIFYYAEGNDLYKSDAEHGYFDYVQSFEWDERVTNLTNANGVLYFNVNGTGKTSLWRSDGTTEGTFSLIEFASGLTTVSPVASVGSDVFFGFQDKLFRSDGTVGGTTLVKDLDPAADRGFLRLISVGETLFISFRKSASEYDLLFSDGTATGTTVLDSYSYIEFMERIGDAVYFVGEKNAGRELWRVSPTGSMTVDLNPGIGSSFPAGGNISATDDERIVFSTATPAGVWAGGSSTQQLASARASALVYAGGHFIFIVGNELWATDGTPSGTLLVKAFHDPSAAAQLNNLVAHGNTAFFVVNGMQLWETDGTVAGTVLIWDHTPPGSSPSGTITLFTSGDALIYFAAFTSSNYPAYFPDIYSYNTNEVRVTGAYLVDAQSDQEINILGDPAFVDVGQHISIRADATLATSNVLFYLNGTVYRRERERPFALAGDGSGNYAEWKAVPGTYQLRIVPFSASGAEGQSRTYQITVRDPSSGCGTGTIVREFWNNVKGNEVTLIPRDRRPTGTEQLTAFQAPSNWGVNYGARVKGYICPPETGAYTFWISSNDQSELWLSSDDQPGNKTRIAFVSGATNPLQWDKSAKQRSSPIQLRAGQRYYVEALHKQGGGTDHLAVGWQLPSGAMERPILGNRLSPFTGNQPPEVRIPNLVDGQVFTTPVNITIRTEIVDSDGFPVNIAYFAGTKLLRQTTDSYFEWFNVPPGAYALYLRVTDEDGGVGISDTVNILVLGQCTASGTVLREQWNGITGTSVSNIPLDRTPDKETELALFESPQNSGTQFGARIRGYLCPPSSGTYTFWISSNDNSELWLSTDEHGANKVRIAWVTGATNPRQWDKFTSQRSAPVSLVAGKRYYIEALHKQGVGTDNLAVGWQLPDGTMERPIAGNRLSPFGDVSGQMSYVVSPADGEQGVDPMVMRLEVEPVIGARRYYIELNTAPDFSATATILRSVDDYQLVYVAKDLAHSTTYYARVRTDISDFGTVSRFTTRDPVGLHRLWGITTAGGSDGVGTIFSFSIDSARFVKHYDMPIVRYYYGEGEDDYVEYEERLRGTPVAGPEGTLYGQRDHDYASNMFEMDQAGHVRWLDPFIFIYDGNIMLASDNKIYVTTSPYLEGGAVGSYPLHDPSMTLQLRVFNAKADGLDPSATLLELPDGFLYGTAREGGLYEGGVVYRMRHDGMGFAVIHQFTGYGGQNPYAGLTEAEGFLYGTTAYGGIGDNNGVVFKVKPDGTQFTTLYDFDGWNGRQPMGEVIVHNGVVYGMTTAGGASDKGIVYRVNSDGSGFTKLHEFSGLDGESPSGKLVFGPSDKLYGMTRYGGVNHYGVIFSIGSDGSGFTKLFDFSASSGGSPEGSLVLREDMFGPPMVSAGASAVNLSVSVHPNPSTDDFNVLVSTPVPGPIQVMLTDQYGQLIATYQIQNGTPVLVGDDLKKGIYIMKVMQGREISMKRIVKK